MKINNFEDINAWQEARKLLNQVYDLTENEGFSEDWGLKNQITRSATSVMSNIAEGFDRSSDKEFIRFLRVSTGSCAEVQSQLYAALDQEYITKKEFDKVYKQANKVNKLLNGFIRYLKKEHDKNGN